MSSWFHKTIIVTDRASKVTMAMQFKGVNFQIKEMPSCKASTISQPSLSAEKQSYETFSLMGGSTKSDTQIRTCPASLFYQTLILLFAPEPKTFLLESSQYQRPALYELIVGGEKSEEVPFNKLQHRTHYTLVFEQLEDKDRLQSIAYSYGAKFRSANAHNTHMYSDVLSLFPDYITILSPEEFLMGTELPIQETVANHCTVDLYERDLLS